MVCICTSLTCLNALSESPHTPTNASSFESLIAGLSQLTTSSDHTATISRHKAATPVSDPPELLVSVTSSCCSLRSLESQMTNMSDLIITTGHESLHGRTVSDISRWHSGMSGISAKAGSYQDVQQIVHDRVTKEVASSVQTPTNATVGLTERLISVAADARFFTKPYLSHAVPIVSLPSKTSIPNRLSSPGLDQESRSCDVCLPSKSPSRLSALSPVFVPRQSPEIRMRQDQVSDTSEANDHGKPVAQGSNGIQDINQRFQVYKLLLSSSSDSLVDISSAATDDVIFGADDYDSKGRLRGKSTDRAPIRLRMKTDDYLYLMLPQCASQILPKAAWNSPSCSGKRTLDFPSMEDICLSGRKKTCKPVEPCLH